MYMCVYYLFCTQGQVNGKAISQRQINGGYSFQVLTQETNFILYISIQF